MRLLLSHSTLLLAAVAFGADRPVTIRFQAQVGEEAFACGHQYEGVGVTKSKISGRDFRFYVTNVRLLDSAGKETPVQLDQDGKWQLDDLALLDFENGTSTCSNGTPDMNQQVTGKIPDGQYTGLRFTLGVPFNKNHADPLTQPSPLNLTALFWVWNAGHKFARLDFSSTGNPRGFLVHLGSTGCTPGDTEITVPTSCKSPNRVEVSFPSFDPVRDAVIADLGALLQNTNVDVSQNPMPPVAEARGRVAGESGMRMGAGCMSGPTTPDCAGLFANFGLPFGERPAAEQKFFRVNKAANSSERAAR
jgi:uncharacterized repeat protein (TIGR04052 family)